MPWPKRYRDWDHDVKAVGDRVGFQVLEWDGTPSKTTKVLIRCVHGERWVFPHGQLKKTSCCKAGSKEGEKNPYYNKPAPNSGKTGSKGHGFGAKPRGSLAEEIGFLYLVVYRCVTGLHLKLGITKDLKRRFRNDQLVTTLATSAAPLGECFVAEQGILEEAERRGWRYSSPSTTELIKGDGYAEVREWVLQGGMGNY